MSTATAERVALPEGFTEQKLSEYSNKQTGWDRQYQFILKRGATEWRVCYMFSNGPLNDRLVLNGEPFHRPVVHVYKGSGHREKFMLQDDAPLYVQQFIKAHKWQVAEFEQQRHGVAPMTMAEWNEEQERLAARQRAVEAAEMRRHEAQVQAVARAIRNVAQCGTVNSEVIAAWVLEKFVERAVHDDVVAEQRETLQEIAGERENEHAEIIDELNCAVDIATRAQEAIGAIDHALDQLGASSLEFAVGNTELEKVMDVLSDGIHAIDKFQWTPSNGDLPEKRKAA